MLPDGWSQQWRVLRFIPTSGSSNLIQVPQVEEDLNLGPKIKERMVVAVDDGGGCGCWLLVGWVVVVVVVVSETRKSMIAHDFPLLA